MRLGMEPVRMAVVGGLCALLMAGCADEGAPAESAAPPAPAPAPAGPAPLTPDQRVVPGDLAGLQSPTGVKTATTKEAYVDGQGNPAEEDYAQERAGDIKMLADKGFVAGAVKVYADQAKSSRGVSAAAQLGTPELARAYEQALYGEEFGTLTAAAQKGTVAGAAASHTVIAKVTEDGEAITHAWASFVDGPFVYLLEAESPGATLNSPAVIEAANALFAKVKGAPAPG
jgi:hypothetical protein